MLFSAMRQKENYQREAHNANSRCCQARRECRAVTYWQRQYSELVLLKGLLYPNPGNSPGFDLDITEAIASGAMVEVDPTGERPFIRVT